MRIGEFAKKHNTTQDTIRHYLNMELLITEKSGGQYRFSDEDSWDLEKIIELKSLHFSLLEIQEILCFHRLAGDMTLEYRSYCKSLLESKKEYFIKEIHKYKNLKTTINDMILEIKASEENKIKLGIPISSIEIFQCPHCKKGIELFNGIIEKNMILEANIKCECGYNASIENGIYLDKSALKTKTLNGKTMPTKKEFLDAASPKFINFYYSGMAIIINYILKYNYKPKYIMELDTCAGTFLMQYMKHLPVNSTYIVICQDNKRMARLKENIETQYNHINFIFLCCDYDRLPISDSSIDIMIDNGLTKNYGKANNKFLPEVVSHLVREKGLLVGSYNYFDTKSTSFNLRPHEVSEIYRRDNTLDRLKNANYETLEVEDIGPIIENNSYNLEISNKELFSVIYSGIKTI